MKRNILATLLVLAAVAFSCTPKEEAKFSDSRLVNDGSVVYNPTVKIQPFEFEGDTKTVLTIDDNTGAKFTFEQGDLLGVYPYSPEAGDQISFAVKEITASSCTFNGGGYALQSGQLYAAYYPLCDEGYGDVAQGISSGEMMTQIPVDYTAQVQSAKNSFDISAADYMVAYGMEPVSGVCNFNMSHIGALLVMDVTFPEAGTFTELSINATGASFLQTGTMDVTTGDVDADQTGAAILSLGNGISVTANETVRFCMMVAPVDLRNATDVTLTLKDDSNVDHSVALAGKKYKAGYAYKIECTLDAAAPAEPTNLCELGTANCYIVDVDNVNPAGYYFTTTVAGNGASMQADIIGYFGATGANLWPQNGNPALIAGTEVRVLWNENNCISDVAYNASDRTISFKATGAKGNAKVCININNINFWTWLIWCTDQPGTIEFTNEVNNCTFTIMDRNIGAITNLGVNDVHAMDGFYYQWGNPIPYNTSELANSPYSNTNNTMLNSLWYPNQVFVPVQWAVQWFAPDGNYPKQLYGLLWGGGSLGAEQAGLDQKYHIRHGNTSTKTMYDPCPPGYKVLPYDVLEGYAKVGASSNTSANVYGIVLAGDNGGEVLIPYNGMGWVTGTGIMSWAPAGVYDPAEDNPCYLYLWTATFNNSNVPFAICCSANNAAEINVTNGNLVVQDASGHAMGIRCVAE